MAHCAYGMPERQRRRLRWAPRRGILPPLLRQPEANPAPGQTGGAPQVPMPAAVAERAKVERLRALARRCRDLSELTAVPEVTRELVGIADALESEAELVIED